MLAAPLAPRQWAFSRWPSVQQRSNRTRPQCEANGDPSYFTPCLEQDTKLPARNAPCVDPSIAKDCKNARRRKLFQGTEFERGRKVLDDLFVRALMERKRDF